MAIGRPSKLTPELVETVCEGVRGGLSYRDSACIAGISHTTFHKYKSLGEAGERPYVDFLERLQKAESDLKQSRLEVIMRAATEPSIKTVTVTRIIEGIEVEEIRVEQIPPQWTPAAWLLERKFQSEFGRRLDLKHGSDEGEWSLSFGKRDGGSS